MVKVNYHDKYTGQRSFHLRVIVQTDTYTQRTDCTTWTTNNTTVTATLT